MSFRYRITLIGFFILFFLIIIRLYYWQVVRASELSALGQAQYGRQVHLLASRGEIKTSDGYPIAANKLSYLAFANPKAIENKDDLSEELSELLKTDKATISASLSLDKFWVPIKSGIESDVKSNIESRKLPGVGFEEQSVRFYPEASMAAKMLGFVGKDEYGEDKGYFGLEGFYDRQLRGKPALAKIIHDAAGRPILSKLDAASGKSDGRSLILHTDRTIQFMLDNTLKDALERYGAKGALAVVINPKTGGVLAMSSFPTFDPRSYEEYSDALYKNPIISDTYEPGSTFKPLVMAEAIDAGLVKPDTRCSICSGPVTIGEYDIHTWNDKYRPNLSMIEVIQHSDNTGMVFVGRLLGLDKMMDLMEKFGIGSLTGVDLQGEVEPGLRDKDSWYPIDLATASFGQGITVTPIELITAFTAIANEGKRMEPHVVSAIETPNGEKINISPKVLGQPISPRTAKIITEMMVNAVDKGEAKWAKPKGYRIAGKTGTAQIPVAGHYDSTKTITSFVGFAPADEPKFLMLVVMDRPTTSIYGAETAAPVFFSAAKKILTYYGIPPTE